MTEGWYSFLHRRRHRHRRLLPPHPHPHTPLPLLFIPFFLRLEIAIALRIKPGLGSLAANEQKGVEGVGGRWVERRKDGGKKTEGVVGEGGMTPKGASGGKP